MSYRFGFCPCQFLTYTLAERCSRSFWSRHLYGEAASLPGCANASQPDRSQAAAWQ